MPSEPVIRMITVKKRMKRANVSLSVNPKGILFVVPGARKVNIREAARETKADWRYESRTGTVFRKGCKRVYLNGQALRPAVTRRMEASCTLLR